MFRYRYKGITMETLKIAQALEAYRAVVVQCRVALRVRVFFLCYLCGCRGLGWSRLEWALRTSYGLMSFARVLDH